MFLMLFLGCVSPEVSTFLDDRAAAICARHARCETLGDAGYDSEDDCLAALDDARGALADEGALGCPDFDAGAVGGCLAAWDVGCDAVPDLAVCDGVCS